MGFVRVFLMSIGILFIWCAIAIMANRTPTRSIVVAVWTVSAFIAYRLDGEKK